MTTTLAWLWLPVRRVGLFPWNMPEMTRASLGPATTKPGGQEATLLNSNLPYFTVLYILYWIALRYTTQHRAILHSTALYCTALHWTYVEAHGPESRVRTDWYRLVHNSSTSTAHCTRYKHCTLHYKQCTVNYNHYTLKHKYCTLHYKQCTVYYNHCTLHYKNCTVNYKHCTLNHKHITINYKHSKLYYKLCTQYITSHCVSALSLLIRLVTL